MAPPRQGLDDSLRCELWKPSLGSLWPKGICRSQVYWTARWLMHYLRIFSTPQYCILIIRQAERVVHYSAVCPRYFRIPAMAAEDLEITTTWTDPQYRGKGLAVYAIREILKLKEMPARRFWYVTREANFASIRVAEKSGLILVGRGTRCNRLGSRLLGSFVLQQQEAITAERKSGC